MLLLCYVLNVVIVKKKDMAFKLLIYKTKFDINKLRINKGGNLMTDLVKVFVNGVEQGEYLQDLHRLNELTQGELVTDISLITVGDFPPERIEYFFDRFIEETKELYLTTR